MDNQLDGHNYHEYKKGEYIFQAEDTADKIYLINNGRVKIGSYNDGGKEITKAILSKGEVFGELAIVKPGKRGDFAMAMENTDCCVIHVNQMQELMREHSGLSIFLMKVLGSRALQMESRLESLVFKDSRSRIIEYLIELVEKRGERVGYEHVVRKFITHQEIANLTATSRQTVTTVLNDLRNRNLITFNRRRLLVRDLDALKDEVMAS
jgi:CRP-like cAMP-binding protein